MQTYEVEIKALLGTRARADQLREQFSRVDPESKLTGSNKQLNHYFEGGDLLQLVNVISPELSEEAQRKLVNIAEQAKTFSVRTREKDGAVLFVIKASVDETTSENGIARIELEEAVDLSLEELDQLILSAGFVYQAKWSREREEYLVNGVNVCLDKNAGYGYLAEFERVVQDESQLESAQREVRALMERLAVEELEQERLARMFAHYNANWPEYYGTDKIFVIE